MSLKFTQARGVRTLPSAFLLLAGSIAPAIAQQPASGTPSDQSLPPVEVTQAKSQKPASQKKSRAKVQKTSGGQPTSPTTPALADQAPSDATPFLRANEALLDVPAGVSVVTGAQALEQNIATARDLAQAAPNITGFDAGGNRMTTFSVRGVHELGYQSSPGVVPSLAYYVDDVPALTTLARASMFENVDQITLYRGPQNTAFGFSRPAGVFDIHSNDPSARPTAYVTGSYGNYNAYEAGAGFSTPLTGNRAFLTADFLTAGRDGFYDNTARDEPYGDKESYGGRVRLTLVPTNKTTIDFFFQHERFDDQSDPFIPLGQLASNPFDVTYNDPGKERIGQDMGAMRIRTSFDGFDLMSVTSYRRSTWDFANDGDQTAAPLNPMNPFARLIGYTAEDVQSTTQEFRLKSNDKSSRLQWSAGLFAAHTVMDFDAGTLAYPNIEMPPFLSLRHAKATSDDVAVYGEVRYALTSELTLVPGLRYEWAGRDGDNRNAAPNITSMSDDFDAVLPSAALVYAPTSTFSAYAKYARGFKPGGFIADRSSSNLDDLQFDSETSDNYEIGFKNISYGGSVIINGALFYSNFKNYQAVTQFSASDFGVNNAQRAESYGGELEASYQVTSAFRIFSGLGVTHAEFNDFENAYGNFSGKNISFIPSFTVNYGFEYHTSWGGYLVFSGRTLGDYYLDEGNASKQAGATILNGVIGFRKGNFDISVFGRNMLDERYVVNTYDFKGTGIGAYGALADPATYGVRTRVTF